MNLRTIGLIGTLATLMPAVAVAQQPLMRPSASALFSPTDVAAAPADTLNVPKTYWKEGALITGIPLGVFGYAFARWGCVDTDSGGDGKNCVIKSIGGFLVGALVGAIPGALIGGQIEKH